MTKADCRKIIEMRVTSGFLEYVVERVRCASRHWNAGKRRAVVVTPQIEICFAIFARQPSLECAVLKRLRFEFGNLVKKLSLAARCSPQRQHRKENAPFSIGLAVFLATLRRVLDQIPIRVACNRITTVDVKREDRALCQFFCPFVDRAMRIWSGSQQCKCERNIYSLPIGDR